MKEQVIELAKQAGIRWDTESDCSEWRMRRSELEELVNVVRNAALNEAAQICDNADCLQNSTFNGAAQAIRNLKEPTP